MVREAKGREARGTTARLQREEVAVRGVASRLGKEARLLPKERPQEMCCRGRGTA